MVESKRPLAQIDPEKERELRHERGREQRYRERIQHRAAHPPQPDGPRNQFFVGRRLPQLKSAPYVQFEGRIALVAPEPDLGGATEFYLGRAFATIDGVDVYDWRNPLGRLFFESAPAEQHTDNVACVRTVHHTGDTLTDYIDDLVGENTPTPVFGRKPVAATGSSSPSATAPTMARQAPTGSAPTHRGSDCQPTTTPTDGAPPSLDRTTPSFIRAEPLLRARLRAPRAKKLGPVLSTLQSEQYRLVTTSAAHSMIIEGGPGTGKTIIASHRAAYFIGDDTATSSALAGNVLVVGPTAEYGGHIDDVITELAGDSERVRVLSLPELKRRLLGGADATLTPAPSWLADTNTSLEDLVREARSRLAHGQDARLTVAQLYEYIRTNGRHQQPPTRQPRAREPLWRQPRMREPDWRQQPLTDEPGWRQYLSTLPTIAQATSEDSRPWLLALIHHTLTPDKSLTSIGHVVVDEAQDVTPTEWLMLRTINPNGGWTILGDLNQRRDDHTCRTWDAVLNALGLPERTVRHQLQSGYRSTVAILEFANRLLPADATVPVALQQDGPRPAIVSTIR